MKAKRFYIKRIEKMITVTDRVTHQAIYMGTLEDVELKDLVNKLITMTDSDYIKYVHSVGIRHKIDKHNRFEYSKEAEEWADTAWEGTTKEVLKELGIKKAVPEYELTVEILEETLRVDEPKKPLPKKTIKKIEKAPEKKVPANMDEARHLYNTKEITLDEYRQYRKQFNK